MLGTDVVVRKTFDVGFLADNGNGDEKPKSLLGQIADNTQETVNILRTAVLGPPGPGELADDRDESIDKGETDKPKGGRFSNALRGIGSALDKVNPFSSGFAFGNIGRALLAGGGLLLISTFRENLIGPLASLLEVIKKSKLGDLIKGGATDAFTALKDTFTMVVEGTTKFVEFIKATYKTIEDFLTLGSWILSHDIMNNNKNKSFEILSIVKLITFFITSYIKWWIN